MKYPIILAMMIMIDAFLIILFIMFNYAYLNPTNGLYPTMMDMANKTMTNPTFLAQVQNGLSLQNEFFGFSMTTCIVLTVIVGVVGSMDKDRQGE